MSVPTDFRFEWLVEKISKIMGIVDTKIAQELIDEHLEQFTAFFDDPINCYADINKQLIFFWRTFYDKMVEETITVLEEVRLPTPPPDKKENKKDKKRGNASIIKVFPFHIYCDSLNSKKRCSC